MATLLIETHSLKPYKQRVLGTYVLLESTLKLLATEGQLLKENTIADRSKRTPVLNMSWTGNKTKPDSLKLLAIKSKILKSTITNSDYVTWTGEPTTMTIANYSNPEPIDFVNRPKGYFIPPTYDDVIERLKMHGIQMEILKEAKEVTVEMYRIQDAKFQNDEGKPFPFEGHIQVSGTPIPETRLQVFPMGSAFISTDQPLGDLAMLLLEPKSADSFLRWGFFHQIFQQTEYIEAYVMEPTMTKMLAESPELQKEFDEKKAKDPVFTKDSNAIYSWFYSKTKYYDERYLLYPVGRSF
jgi:hypothetical protein